MDKTFASVFALNCSKHAIYDIDNSLLIDISLFIAYTVYCK